MIIMYLIIRSCCWWIVFVGMDCSPVSRMAFPDFDTSAPFLSAIVRGAGFPHPRICATDRSGKGALRIDEPFALGRLPEGQGEREYGEFGPDAPGPRRIHICAWSWSCTDFTRK